MTHCCTCPGTKPGREPQIQTSTPLESRDEEGEGGERKEPTATATTPGLTRETAPKEKANEEGLEGKGSPLRQGESGSLISLVQRPEQHGTEDSQPRK